MKGECVRREVNSEGILRQNLVLTNRNTLEGILSLLLFLPVAIEIILMITG